MPDFTYDITIYDLGIRGNSTRMIGERWRRECEAHIPATAGEGYAYVADMIAA